MYIYAMVDPEFRTMAHPRSKVACPPPPYRIDGRCAFYNFWCFFTVMTVARNYKCIQKGDFLRFSIVKFSSQTQNLVKIECLSALVTCFSANAQSYYVNINNLLNAAFRWQNPFVNITRGLHGPDFQSPFYLNP